MSLNSKPYNGNGCLCLVCAAVVCVFGGTVFGQPWDGNGVEGDPYQIWDANDMQAIGANGSYWDKHFKLMADIDLSDFNGLGGNAPFNLIGTFSGTFDGGGHTISNFTYTSTGTDNIGLFRTVSGVIKNLGLIEPNVDGGTGSNVAGLAAYVEGGTISGCYLEGGSVRGLDWVTGGLVGWLFHGTASHCCVRGTSITGGFNAGGLVGRNGVWWEVGEPAVITNCCALAHVKGDISVLDGWGFGALVGENSDNGTISHCFSGGTVGEMGLNVDGILGGLVGQNDGKISDCASVANISGGKYYLGGLVGNHRTRSIFNCYSSGSITSEQAHYVGGLTGMSYGSISNCYATGTVSGKIRVGGLVGETHGPSLVTECYAHGDVSESGGGSEAAGGLIGVNFGASISNCYASGDISGTSKAGGLLGWNGGTISNCYSVGSISGISRIGGLVGYDGTGTFVNSFWDVNTSGEPNSAGGTPKTTEQMQTQSTFTSAGWDFNTPIWAIDEGNDYPRLSRTPQPIERGHIFAWPITLEFDVPTNGANPEPQALSIRNCGAAGLQWTVGEHCDWLVVEPNSGICGAYEISDVNVSVDTTGVAENHYSCQLTISDANAFNTEVTVEVALHVGDALYVPGQYSTIQAAIDDAAENDVIIVEPGTYYENIDFNGKNVKVSSTYPDDWDVIASTIIDGNNQGTVITFESDEDPNCQLTGFTITDGNDEYEGGGIRINRDTSPTISNCIVAANKGLGIYSFRSQPKITNCLIAGNTAAGTQTTGRDSATITNCTIVENGAEGIYSSFGKPTITNCIIWGNADPCIAERPVVTFSDIEGGSAGLGNIDKDPCFALPGLWVDINDANIILAPGEPNGIWLQGDYHLLEGSPCIDVGDPNYAAGPNETDLAGNPRVADGDGDGNSVVDMGAYEFTIAEPVEPLEMLAELGEMVEGLGLSEGVENSLLAKVEAAIGALEDDNEKNDGAAVNILGAFINAASAQSGKKISEADADALIAEAAAIIEALESG